MSMPTGPDPIERLSAADPIRADDVPAASLARVSARIQESIVTDSISEPRSTASRRPLALIGGVALVGAFAFAIALGNGLGAPAPGIIGAVPSPTDEAPPTDEVSGGGGMASCIMYDTAILPTMETVFDGSVTAIDGDQVTFEVNTGWKGVEGSVTLTAPETSIALLGPAPTFEVGERYLVTAAGSNINSCGYTLDYDADTAAAWAAAFGS